MRWDVVLVVDGEWRHVLRLLPSTAETVARDGYIDYAGARWRRTGASRFEQGDTGDG